MSWNRKIKRIKFKTGYRTVFTPRPSLEMLRMTKHFSKLQTLIKNFQQIANYIHVCNWYEITCIRSQELQLRNSDITHLRCKRVVFWPQLYKFSKWQGPKLWFVPHQVVKIVNYDCHKQTDNLEKVVSDVPEILPRLSVYIHRVYRYVSTE